MTASRLKLVMRAIMAIVLFSTVIYRTPSKTFLAIVANSELKVTFGFVLVFDMS